METRFQVHFFSFVYEWIMSEQSGVNVENERAEWMWTIPAYLERIMFCIFFLKYTLLCMCFCWAEQIWSGRSRCGQNNVENS